jgi:hypothetical protein
LTFIFQLPDEDVTPVLDNGNLCSSIPERPESELEIIEEEQPVEKRSAAKRFLMVSESDEEEEAPPKKRGRKPKAAPKLSAPPKESAG